MFKDNEQQTIRLSSYLRQQLKNRAQCERKFISELIAEYCIRGLNSRDVRTGDA